MPSRHRSGEEISASTYPSWATFVRLLGPRLGFPARGGQNEQFAGHVTTQDDTHICRLSLWCGFALDLFLKMIEAGASVQYCNPLLMHLFSNPLRSYAPTQQAASHWDDILPR